MEPPVPPSDHTEISARRLLPGEAAFADVKTTAEFLCNLKENMQARCVPSRRRDLIGGSQYIEQRIIAHKPRAVCLK